MKHFAFLAISLWLCVPFTSQADQAKAIPLDQLGAEAQKQYAGDGIAITPTQDGARLKAIMQRIEGEATPEGLWLASTADEDAGKPNRFRVKAAVVGRERSADTSVRLARQGAVRTTQNSAVWLRPSVIEEYSVSVDGVRQDFVVLERPRGDGGSLVVDLEVTGAHAEVAAFGVKLTVDATGRELAYSKLKVTDATGKELTARLEVVNPEQMCVTVTDTDAVYPVRIDPTFSDADWVSLNGSIPGTNGWVFAATIDAAGNAYIGGTFTVAGAVVANGIAKWNGSTWSALGSGLAGLGTGTVGVYALALDGGNLYLGGNFQSVGGVSAKNIAIWNGSTWAPLGAGTNDTVDALAVSGSDLYAGGSFTSAGGNSAQYVAKWNGTSWSALGTGMDSAVLALAANGGNLYAGGVFTTAGGVPANRVAKWDGAGWSPLGAGVDQRVLALAASGTDLYAGGDFTAAGGVAASRVARWNGTEWSALGSGATNAVVALAINGADLYAGGDFSVAGGVPNTSHIAKWDGNAWSALGAGTGQLSAIAVRNGKLFAGGTFTAAGGKAAANVAKWDGSDWTAAGTGMNATPKALLVIGPNLYVGGDFMTVGAVAANRVAKWNGSTWSALGSGMNLGVNTLATDGVNLYAGGSFTTAGGAAASCIAKWDGSAWSALGAGIAEEVYAIVTKGSEVYASTFISSEGGMIARWDGAAWSSIASGMDNVVNAMTFVGSNLYVGGDFSNVAGVSGTSRIARWDGSAWYAMGSGIVGSRVNALAVIGSDLYVGGSFASAGGVPNTLRIAKWDGNAWAALGSGMNQQVGSLVASGPDLIAGGTFTTAGGVSANRIAKWNGTSWTALGSGLDGACVAMAGDAQGHLFVSGSFNFAGTSFSPFLVQANLNGSAPEIVIEQPAGNNLTDGAGLLDFGGLKAGNDVTRVFTVRNTGAALLSGIAVTLTGAHAGTDFGLTVAPPASIAAGDIATFSVTFIPSALGTRTATIQVASNDADENPFDIAITGEGLTASQDWRQTYFGSTGVTGNAAPTADPNKNGISNLLEYALGGDPVGGSTGKSILPEVGINTSAHCAEFNLTRYLDRDDITLTVQAADSLSGPWTDLARSVNGTAFTVVTPGAVANETGSGSTRSVKVCDLYQTTDPAHPRRFMRLVVSQ